MSRQSSRGPDAEYERARVEAHIRQVDMVLWQALCARGLGVFSGASLACSGWLLSEGYAQLVGNVLAPGDGYVGMVCVVRVEVYVGAGQLIVRN